LPLGKGENLEKADEARSYATSYGKVQVPVYRVYAKPLSGIPTIPESSFAGRPNTLFAALVDVEVFGDNFLSSYTMGDNSNVVATDSMKNFVLQQALTFEGSTIEAFLDQLGHAFLPTYPQMERLRLTGRELPFAEARVPTGEPGAFAPSSVLLSALHDDYSTASLEFARAGNQIERTSHRCGRVGMQLLKVTGSSFSHFVRDQYTTLPERVDRPLFVYLDVFWQYIDAEAMLGLDGSRYVAAEQVRDLVSTTFHEFVSESIQHLVHEMGQRLLDRFPQIHSVTFEAQNRTPDPVASSTDAPRVKVYTSPFSAYGLIQLTIRRG
jgi:urate oxidase